MKALENLTPNEKQALDELVGRLRHQFKRQIAQVILFGSRARGDASWESDFDLLIVTKNGGTKLEKTLTEFPSPIAFEHNLVLTSHVIPQKEFVQKRKAEPFYRSIYSEGINLIGKKPRRLARGKPLVYRPPRRGFKMDENARIQIRIRLEQARKDLATAHRTIVEDKNFPRAVSTAYYAVFALTTAVLLTLDLVRAKHSGVESAFSEYFIREKRLEEEYKDIFIKARRERELADYKFKNYTQEQAQQILADCERFVARMERYLREVGALKE